MPLHQQRRLGSLLLLSPCRHLRSRLPSARHPLHAHRRRLSGDDVYVAIFAEHGISEWEDSSAHFLKCGASAACGDVFPGADIELECVGDVDHSGHDHGRRLAACPKHSESDGASKPAVALALAALAGGLALFL